MDSRSLKKALEAIAAEEIRDEANEIVEMCQATKGIDCGFLRLSAVTDEWTKEHPLWKGPGAGLFKGRTAPQTANEFRGLHLQLLITMVSGNRKASTQSNTFASRAATLAARMNEHDINYADVMEDFLNKKIGAELVLNTHLLFLSIPTAKGCFATLSTVAYRLSEPLAEEWKARRIDGEQALFIPKYDWKSNFTSPSDAAGNEEYPDTFDREF